MHTKQELRREALRKIKLLEDPQTSALRAAERMVYLLSQLLPTPSEKKEGSRIGLFLSLPTEISTAPLLSLLQDNILLVPRVENNEEMHFFPYNPTAPHQISRYGIWEPIAPIEESLVPDIMIVPGVAFDMNGGRIGHGKGYYDRYFSRYAKHSIRKIALCYDAQLFDSVPTEEHDHQMEWIVTDKRLLSIK